MDDGTVAMHLNPLHSTTRAAGSTSAATSASEPSSQQYYSALTAPSARTSAAYSGQLTAQPSSAATTDFGGSHSGDGYSSSLTAPSFDLYSVPLTDAGNEPSAVYSSAVTVPSNPYAALEPSHALYTSSSTSTYSGALTQAAEAAPGAYAGTLTHAAHPPAAIQAWGEAQFYSVPMEGNGGGGEYESFGNVHPPHHYAYESES